MTHTILIENFNYIPESLAINAGDEVIWENRDAHAHTATREDDPAFDERVAAGSTSAPVAFEQPSGEEGYSYFCKPHPFMTGKIVVT